MEGEAGGGRLRGGALRMRGGDGSARAMLSRVLGPRYAQLLQSWTPTLLTWGGVAGTGLVWFTDWKLLLQHVPYIGGKYKAED